MKKFMSVLSVNPASNLNIYTCPNGNDSYVQLPWMTTSEDSKYNGVVIKPIFFTDDEKLFIHAVWTLFIFTS